MTQTKTPTFIQQLRERHQALAKAAALSGVIPEAFADDPAFHNLVSTFLEKSPVATCAEK